MEITLEIISKGPQGLFDYIESCEAVSDLMLGAVLASDYTSLSNPFQFFKVLYKIWRSQGHNFLHKSYILKKQVLSYFSHIFKSKESILISQFPQYLETLEFISLGFREYDLTDKQGLLNKILDCYKEIKFHIRETPHLLKLIKFGKNNSDIYIEVSDDIINSQEIDKLLSIFESEEFAEGSLQLNILCQKVLPTRVPFLYDFVTTALIYLIENKAKPEHFEQISQFFMTNAKSFNKKKKKKIALVYEKFFGNIKVAKENGWEELKNRVLMNLGAKERLQGKWENDEKLKFQEKPIEEVKVKENEGKKLGNGEPTQKFNKRIKGKKNFVPAEEFKQPKPQFEKKKGPQNTENSKKNFKNAEKPEQILSHTTEIPIKTSPKSQIPPKPSDTPAGPESQIDELISEANFLYESKQRIEVQAFYEKFMEITYPKPSILFHKIDELMAKDRPSQENAKFWSIILKVLDKLPDLNHYEMSALRDKHKRLKGKVRDNKEKVSRKKEQKVEYKEKLRKEKKFVEGFVNGDREQKRGQKSDIKSFLDDHYQDFKEYCFKLTEELNRIVEEFSLNSIILNGIDKAIKSIIYRIKAVVSDVNVKIIGSAGIGTYLKTGKIDLLVIDKNDSVLEFLPNIFEGLVPCANSVFEYSDRSSGFVFNLHTKNLLQTEVTALIKKYCLIDNRATKLVILFKLWLKSENIEWVTGFQATLLVLGFLQTVNPPIIVSLQCSSHIPKQTSSSIDTWFDSEYSSPSANLWIFGEVVYHFFNHYASNLNGTINLKQGSHTETPNFQILHPFTEENIIQAWSDSQLTLLASSFSGTLSKLENLSELILQPQNP